MTADRGLFERLRALEHSGQRSVAPRADRVFESVLEHLERLLNTRQGQSATVPDYGIPALSDAGRAGQAAEMRRAIEQAIRDFEPRLEGIRVRLLPNDETDPQQIRFEIQARVVTDEERLAVRFKAGGDDRGTGWKLTT